MDSVVAKRMEKELRNTKISGWDLQECIGYGKSAMVFRGIKTGCEAAIKVFDRDIVDRFGKDAQRERIMREKQLIGKKHPNLVEIFDAGEAPGTDLFFVAMELVDSQNFDQARDTIPIEMIQPLISQVASAAQFLEEQDPPIVHRDIKPENISVSSDFTKAVLLDLGVIRPIGLGNITDDKGQREFVGTLQYAPPELLFREELDSVEGWRAVTFYQLGGVLHDLLTKHPLFSDFVTPYARLVEAVKSVTPEIIAPDAHPDLVVLAKNCLVKPPETRLELVKWESFSRKLSQNGDAIAALERIRQRRIAGRSISEDRFGNLNHHQFIKTVKTQIEQSLRDAVAAADAFPPLTMSSEEREGNQVCFHASFKKSQECSVPISFNIVIIVDLLDIQSKVIRISAALHTGMRDDCNTTISNSFTIFEGVLSGEIVRQKISGVLIIALDHIQQIACGHQLKLGEWLSFPLNGV